MVIYAGTIALVVTDKPEAFVVERANNVGIETLAIKPSSFSSKEAYEQAILQKLKELEVEWIVLAGYMRLIGDVLLEAFPNRIVNIHPSLTPCISRKRCHWTSIGTWREGDRSNGSLCRCRNGHWSNFSASKPLK